MAEQIELQDGEQDRETEKRQHPPGALIELRRPCQHGAHSGVSGCPRHRRPHRRRIQDGSGEKPSVACPISGEEDVLMLHSLVQIE